MLSKQNRISKNDFNIIFKNGKTILSPIFVFKYQKNLENQGRFSFVVPKTVVKSAVKRNSLRRKGFNSLKNKGFPAISGIFIYKKGVDKDTPISEIRENIRIILEKIIKNEKISA